MKIKTIDRRIQRTRQLLLDALVALILDRGYDSVTVQDIIDRANVGRSTFYAHFKDKEDLLLSGFELLRNEFDQHLVTEKTAFNDPWGFSLVVFRHIQNNPRLLKSIVGLHGNASILQRFSKYLTLLIQAHIKEQFPEKARQAVPPEILAQFITSSLVGMLTWWLDNDLPYSAERMNEMYQLLTQPGVNGLFQLKNL